MGQVAWLFEYFAGTVSLILARILKIIEKRLRGLLWTGVNKPVGLNEHYHA